MTAKIYQSLVIFAVVLCLTMAANGNQIGLLYNSSSGIQHKLYLAAWMGLRDALPDDGGAPNVVDVQASDAAARLLENQTTRIVSLLEREELVLILDGYKRLILEPIETGTKFKSSGPSLFIVLPRECIDLHNYIVPGIGPLSQIECMQMEPKAMATVLLHRAARVAVTKLVPVTMATTHAVGAKDLYRIYKEISYYSSRAPMQMTRMATGIRELQVALKSGNSSDIFGLLVLDREPEAVERILNAIPESRSKFTYIFTPWGFEGQDSSFLKELPFTKQVYSAIFIGSQELTSRRRLLAALSEVVEPGPLQLHALLAYDGAVQAARGSAAAPEDLKPLSIVSATRAPSSGIFYGVAPKPMQELRTSGGVLLQESDFVLEDVITLSRPLVSQIGMGRPSSGYKVVDYKAATVSIFSSGDFEPLALAGDSKLNCRNHSHGLRVTTWDPFTGQPIKREFHSSEGEKLPAYLLIPNQHGYGLELSCDRDHGNTDATSVIVTSISVACTPAAPSGVHCYRSNAKHVQKRDTTTPDSAPMPYANPMDMSMYMNVDMTTSGPPAQEEAPTTTTEEPATTTTTPAPAPPAPPLPDLRMMLRAAKPFIGGCIGAQLGCAICAIWLSRSVNYIGVQPAACAGPCFTGTFGQCWALLGRVASETTVICTELFRLGRIDAETFLADAEFGKRMKMGDPMTLKGYRVLATPLVRVMRESETVTDLVTWFAEPWAEHMKNIVETKRGEGGFDGDGAWGLGAWIHWVGAPICYAVGHIATFLEKTEWNTFFYSILVILAAFLVFARKRGAKMMQFE